MERKIGTKRLQLIDDLVNHFVIHKGQFSILLESINSNIEHSIALKKLIHSTKARIKDPDHLRDKLIRKAKEAEASKTPFHYTKENLFATINDLAGFRIIHLHTKQFQKIDEELKKIFTEQRWKIVEGPNARTWDDESRSYFTSIGVQISTNSNMYTSVHYIISPNTSSAITFEIQVRTLMEEVWGEVDHTINYPHKSESLSCREQIKTLARVTSSCSRLVDSIFATDEYERNRNVNIVERIPSKKTAKSAPKQKRK
ncbi:RelA/SpoT domain-containing protein [Paraflavitalea sp. CAU 1676]|uniref:RelA/SpoT domain-containing protein n=1 Tax=Paraflavitalea sp. CAU 1676 TaxID=3032598 RepID=UPI0023DA3F03|nr:RelA/SpoT domain-containing protein [Paraflavitalea sp. CAU 1676]MDF2189839.1 RelA/SpoT domain-containing protein [Paraflavitalea sp. CAU 1676]